MKFKNIYNNQLFTDWGKEIYLCYGIKYVTNKERVE